MDKYNLRYSGKVWEKKNDDVFALMWLVENDKSKKIKYEVYCRGKKKLLMSIVGKKK